MIARKDVVYTLGGIVNHDGGRLNQDKCNLLTYFFSVEKRKTGEYLAAKVVSWNSALGIARYAETVAS